MPVGVLVELEGPGPEMYDAVTAEMNIADNPPAGLIVHTGGAIEGGMRIFDIWESANAYNEFRDSRLMPAIAKVGGEQAAAGPSTAEIYELRNVVRP